MTRRRPSGQPSSRPWTPAARMESSLEAAAMLDPDTPRYAELSRWVSSPASGLDERFAATLLCHERLRGGEHARRPRDSRCAGPVLGR